MRLTATKVYLPEHPWDSTRTGVGVDENDVVYTFAGDARPMEGLRELIEEQGEVEIEVEDWQILGKIEPTPADHPTLLDPEED